MTDPQQTESSRESARSAEIERLTAERDHLAAKLDEVLTSRSWALTAPLRNLMLAGKKRVRGEAAAPPPVASPAPAPERQPAAPPEPAAPPAPPEPEESPDLPPPALRARVTGTEREEWFRSSGAMAIEDISSALATLGRSLDDFQRIYDFGCGCGRISLPLSDLVPASRLTATDADVEATDWLRGRLPEAGVAANGDLPPLPYGDDSFDLIIGWSVMTHLPEDFQDAWLAELARVLAPGGTMLLTVHGPTHFDKVDAPADDPSRVALHEKGIVYFENYGPDSPFAPYYQTTYHHPDYIRDHWSQWLEIADIIVDGARPTHDMVVTTKKS